MDDRKRLRPAEAEQDEGTWPDLVRRAPDSDESDDPEARPSANQHSFEGEEFATDTARHYHGPDKPA